MRNGKSQSAAADDTLACRIETVKQPYVGAVRPLLDVLGVAAVESAVGWPFHCLHDEDKQIARAFGAVCTPDFFGLDGNLRLRYRGRADVSLQATTDSVAPRELFEAMRQIADTGHGWAEQHSGIGCSIKWRA